jgi:radical SAM protein with 4Fe4S-binding SPASM domain
LRRLGLSDSAFAGRVVDLEHAGPGYSAPLAAHLGVTTACNFSCNHCYSSSGRRSDGELTLPECQAVVDELAEMGCCKLVLGGGEPFVRKDLPDLIAHADQAGVDVFVHSNGTLLDVELLERLAREPPAGLTVSLDGARAETNDAVRGPGTFAAIMESFERLNRHYSPGFAISMTITGPNLDDVAEAVQLAHDVGATMLFLRPPFPSGNLLDNEHLMVGLPEFWRALEAAHERASEIGQTINAPMPGGPVLPTDFEGFGCIAGHVVLGITPRGDVTPCLNLPGRFVAGNVRTTSILDLWRSGASFEHLRTLEPQADCASCEHYEMCRGGCRIRAIHQSGEDNAPDSWCYAYAYRGEDRPPPSARLRVLA